MKRAIEQGARLTVWCQSHSKALTPKDGSPGFKSSGAGFVLDLSGMECPGFIQWYAEMVEGFGSAPIEFFERSTCVDSWRVWLDA